MNPIEFAKAILKWAAGEAREKLDLAEKWNEIVDTGKEWGLRFVIFAVVWEIIEDGVFPILAWYFGAPWLIPVFLIWHFEPVVYPIAFWCFRTYDRIQGRKAWEADRPGYSSHKRTVIKVMTYRAVSVGGLFALLQYLDLSLWLLSAYVVLMTVFNFVHERIWHDSNFGITEDDEVLPQRVLMKALSYRTVSMMLMGGALASLNPMPWGSLLTYQVVMLLAYLSLETAWSTSTLGISEGSAL